MIEVFKTNINCRKKAALLLQEIHSQFLYVKANFDLEDCDRILRVRYNDSNWKPAAFIGWLKENDCIAEILP